MNLLRFSRWYFFFSSLLIAGALGSVVFLGIDFGIEFTGGSILQITYLEERPPVSDVRETLTALGVGEFQVQELGERGMILRTGPLAPEQEIALRGAFGEQVREERFENVGPVVGRELREATLFMLALAALAIIIYITLAFRRITEPLHSWQYSLAAFIPLVHDVLLPLGVISLLGAERGAVFTIPVAVALLTVFGYSVNNTVVTFDRIRENLFLQKGFDFRDTVSQSMRQTLPRNLNTSLTTLFVVASLLFLGGETLWLFAATLFVGIAAGTYSSLFLAPSFLVLWSRLRAPEA
ncbi:MAG: protein translocase subunit SecF [Patescibacteria group bacterium]